MKGSIQDLPLILVVMLSSGITVMVVYLLLSQFYAAWPMTGESLTILETGVETMQVFDYMFLFFAVSLSLVSIISAFFIKTKPIFFIFSIILLVVVIAVSTVVTNVFDKFITTDTFLPIANNFPYTVIIMRNLPLFCLVVGIVISVVMYGKPTGGTA